ncbi:MAG: hypothetical protein ACTHXC_00435 [Brachybacterium sp.]
MPIPDDLTIYPLLMELSACLCAELGEGATPCFCGVLVGNSIPVEYADSGCDNCGAAYVRMASAYPSTQLFPNPDDTAQCNSVLAFSVAVGVVRCAPIGDSQGNPPEASEMAEISRQLLADMSAIRRAIICCFAEKYEDVEYVLGTYEPTPNEGGVAGGEWTVTIQEQF